MSLRRLLLMTIPLLASAGLSAPAEGAVVTFAPPGCTSMTGGCHAATELANGDVLVTSTPQRRVLRLSASGTLIGSIGATDPGRLDAPWNVATDAAGRIYVADGNIGTRVYDAAGAHVGDLGAGSSRAVAVTPGGAAFVNNGQYVTAYDAAGTQTAQWPPSYDPFADLHGAAVSPVSGNVYVADTKAREVIELTPSLSVVRRWPAAMSGQTGLAVDAAGSVYVSSPFEPPYAISKYAATGAPLGSFAPGGQSWGLSIVGSRLWAGAFGTIHRIDLDRPVAAIARDKDPRTSQSVTFDASRSFLPFGSITGCAFDLDGDGTYETDTETRCAASRRFDSAGTFGVGVRVTAGGGSDETRMTVPVGTSAAALAAPARVLTGQTARFDASGSLLADAAVSRFEWDLDGNGSFETTTTGPQTERAYTTRGPVDVTVRVVRAGGTVDAAGARVAVLPAPQAGAVGVSINNGALYTNDPQVTLTTRWPAFSETMLVSNDGGFAGAAPVGLAEASRWSLARSGPERLPKTVYVRFDGGTQTFQDDIILDETAPTVTATVPAATARAAGRKRKKPTVTVRVTAKDRTSGVARLAFGTSRKARLVVRKNAKSVKVKGFRPRYVRAQDRAGNWSSWKTIRAPRKTKRR